MNTSGIECIECEREIAEDETVRYGDYTVCMNCKNRLVDKMKLGEPVGRGPWKKPSLTGPLQIVFPRGFEFPDRCLVCGAEGRHRIREVLKWSPSFRLTVRGERFRVPHELPLCREHFAKRQNRSWFWVLKGFSFLLSLAGISLFIVQEFIAGFCLISLGLMAIGLIEHAAVRVILRVVKMDEKYVYANCTSRARAYVQSLVSFSGIS